VLIDSVDHVIVYEVVGTDKTWRLFAIVLWATLVIDVSTLSVVTARLKLRIIMSTMAPALFLLLLLLGL
jgi:hypothetical protein